MKMTVKDFKAVQKQLTIANILSSMKAGEWRADQPLVTTQYMPGVDTILGEDFVKEFNKGIGDYMKKANRKLLREIKRVEKDCMDTFKDVDGMIEEVYERFPTLNPDYVVPSIEEGPKEA